MPDAFFVFIGGLRGEQRQVVIYLLAITIDDYTIKLFSQLHGCFRFSARGRPCDYMDCRVITHGVRFSTNRFDGRMLPSMSGTSTLPFGMKPFFINTASEAGLPLAVVA